MSNHPTSPEALGARLHVNQKYLSPLENDFPTLYITSYGHRFGPLATPPRIAVDLRTLPNPPKTIRSGQTGLSKPLRDWLFVNEEVLARFSEICGRIRAELDEVGARGEKELKVGVNCEMGKHRSVAVVEELARTKFEGWNVVVDHRDVHRKRSSKKPGHSKHRRDGGDDS
ncbi:hypothetical protein HYPSUDRAFT_40008 [Hypholoma sublateritium FD-334 SS-4]|uniref:RapZ C-terminal domain-containing protein n=1 Tax=Hypholoma sublateritium (strain FD-334 SS-4) TaxID=945553 RepID=A0A0D2L7U5_HYPSF|nr:hypothetical protein HYPSUDRAFT_40008 [Hypholoma sublateritium FD-334 SS-4]